MRQFSGIKTTPSGYSQINSAFVSTLPILFPCLPARKKDPFFQGKIARFLLIALCVFALLFMGEAM